MARNLGFFFVVFLIITSLSFNVVGRPINFGKSIKDINGVDYKHLNYADNTKILVLNLWEIKTSGPSPGGTGHEFPNHESLGENKNSGPSPGGKGHDFPSIKSLGDIKNSGPSPGGNGHGSPNFESLGDIKSSGQSVETRGLMNSGSKARGKGHNAPSFEILGNIKNSGPSPGGKGN